MSRLFSRWAMSTPPRTQRRSVVSATSWTKPRLIEPLVTQLERSDLHGWLHQEAEARALKHRSKLYFSPWGNVDFN